MQEKKQNEMVATEVERVFTSKGWKSFAQAELATGLPVGTLQRLRKGLGKADTIVRFGIASGEQEEKWKRIAVGLVDKKRSADPLLDVAEDVPNAALLLHEMGNVQEVGANLERLTPNDDTISEPIPIGGYVRVMRIRNDCMMPMLEPGDVVFITGADTANDGDIVIAAVDVFSRTCKVLRTPAETESYLEPLNGEGRIMEQRFTVLGVVKYRLQSVLELKQNAKSRMAEA